MDNINYYNPTCIVSGEGCMRDFTGWREFGNRCLIVTGRSSAKLCGAYNHAVAGMEAAGVAHTLFDRVEQNPLADTCYEGGAFARCFGADFILGIGGGSPLDAAKAIAAYAANPGIEKLGLFSGEKRTPALPVLACGTTAGTGSEVTPYSILTVREFKNKRSFAGDDLYPRVAFLDPVYTYSLPLEFTAATAVDALCHAVEGYFGIKASLVSDELALKSAHIIADGLRSIVKNDLGPAVRAGLLYASTMAGMVISRTGTGFVHSLGYNLTYRHDIPHGRANAFYIADFLEFMSERAPEKGAAMMQSLGIRNAGELYALVSPLLDLSLPLSAESIGEYAGIAMQAKNMVNSVAKPSEEDIIRIMRKRHG